MKDDAMDGFEQPRRIWVERRFLSAFDNLEPLSVRDAGTQAVINFLFYGKFPPMVIRNTDAWKRVVKELYATRANALRREGLVNTPLTEAGARLLATGGATAQAKLSEHMLHRSVRAQAEFIIDNSTSDTVEIPCQGAMWGLPSCGNTVRVHRSRTAFETDESFCVDCLRALRSR